MGEDNEEKVNERRERGKEKVDAKREMRTQKQKWGEMNNGKYEYVFFK